MSPNSLQPLRCKDLVELDIKRNIDNQVLCAISEKAIVTQQAIALVPKKVSKDAESSTSDVGAQVVLEQVYDDVMGHNSEKKKTKNKDGSKKDKKKIICPVTGRKISKIIKLQRGGSSFASLLSTSNNDDGTGTITNQNVIAKTYRPSMT